MPKPVPRRELIRRFRKLGFEGPIAGAKHSFMKKGDLKVRIPNPHGSDIGNPLLNEVLKQAGISAEAWEKAA